MFGVMRPCAKSGKRERGRRTGMGEGGMQETFCLAPNEMTIKPFRSTSHPKAEAM